jgi:hypothetical protein
MYPGIPLEMTRTAVEATIYAVTALGALVSFLFCARA